METAVVGSISIRQPVQHSTNALELGLYRNLDSLRARQLKPKVLFFSVNVVCATYHLIPDN